MLDAVVFPHTCDSIQRLSDIWRLNIKQHLHFDVVLPVKLNTESAFDYLVDVLARFRTQLETSLGTTIDDAGLKKSIETYNHLRELLAGLYRIKRESPGSITGRDLQAVAKSAMIMDRQEMITLLEELLARVTANRHAAIFNGKRVILSGGLCNQGDIYATIEQAGAAVVWDDLCTGARAVGGRIDSSGDLLSAIARRYRERVACPAKHQGRHRRGEALAAAVKRYKADGVVLVRLKFCDPHAFDYPYLKEVLDDAGISSLLIEFEDQPGNAGQMSTRLEAFVEML